MARLELLTAALAETTTAEQVAEVVVTQLSETTRPRAAALIELDRHDRTPRILHANGDAVTALIAEPRIAEPIAAVTTSGEARWAEVAPAWATIPLALNKRVLGCLVLEFETHHVFPIDERELLRNVAQQGALALERARLLTAEKEARLAAELTADRIGRLQVVTAGLAEVLSPEGAAQVVVDQAVAAMGAIGACVALMNEDAHTLELAAYVNLSEAVHTQLKRFTVSDSMLMAETLRTGAPIFLRSDDVGAERSPWLAQARESAKAGSLASVPLTIGGRTIGSMGLAFEGFRTFDTHDREFLIAMAGQCSQALERVRLYSVERTARTDAETRDRQNAFLAHASALLSNSLDYATTLSSIAQLAVADLADWCIIDLVDEDQSMKRLSVRHKDAAKAELARELCRDYPLDPKWPDGIAKTLRTGESQLVPKVSDALMAAIGRNARHSLLLRGLGYRSGMTVALRNRGTIIGALTFVRSTDDRPYAARDLALAEQLAARSATAIDNARLYAQAMEAINDRDSFISVASHELRTPLSTFKLGVDVLSRLARTQQAELTERIPAVLDKVRNQSDRLERLVSQLMDVSRLAAGRLKLDVEPVELSDLVREVAGRFADDALVMETELRVDASTRAAGRWDRLRIDQVITNLISNAMKYGRGSPIDVAVATTESEVLLSVRDRGIGIALEDQKRIFDRFERAGLDKRITGLGLGLWIVREIVRAHGGRVGVESALGQGATFTVALPLKAP